MELDAKECEHEGPGGGNCHDDGQLLLPNYRSKGDSSQRHCEDDSTSHQLAPDELPSLLHRDCDCGRGYDGGLYCRHLGWLAEDHHKRRLPQRWLKQLQDAGFPAPRKRANAGEAAKGFVVSDSVAVVDDVVGRQKNCKIVVYLLHQFHLHRHFGHYL